MSEPTTPLPEDLYSFLAAAGPDAVALVETDTLLDLVAWEEAPVPVVGETGLAGAASSGEGTVVRQVCRGRHEALLQWLKLDDGHRQLALVTADQGTPVERTPGELAAGLLQDPTYAEAELVQAMSRWLAHRSGPAPQGLQAGWSTAAAAWTCHMRALSSVPPASVLAQARAHTGDDGPATEELVLGTGMKLADLIDRMDGPHRTRADLVADWRTVQPLAAAVPGLKAGADWLLDQIALRDARSQQLRAVLEPDISDHLRDRRTDDSVLHPSVPALDPVRAAQLAQARRTVRCYTATFYSGRTPEAELLLNAFPAPARSLQASAPALAWRQRSATARDALDAVMKRRTASSAEDDTAYFADPERLHAESAYLAAVHGRLDLVHDALGRLSASAPLPEDVPEDLHELAAQMPVRRLADAFGSRDRAVAALNGQIAYLQQEPTPTYRRKSTPGELALLRAVRDTVAFGTPPTGERLLAGLDEDAIRRRVEQIRAAPAEEPGGTPPPPSRHEQGHRLAAQTGALGVRP
ncbi:hypothetical protein [Streptomyces sp. NPDC048272]|uniref:hypothetical protein n=1 Tax=Streptomyces sp. NPDC048272 TaxID=3154616 RepID=UPI0034412A5E